MSIFQNSIFSKTVTFLTLFSFLGTSIQFNTRWTKALSLTAWASDLEIAMESDDAETVERLLSDETERKLDQAVGALEDREIPSDFELKLEQGLAKYRSKLNLKLASISERSAKRKLKKLAEHAQFIENEDERNSVQAIIASDLSAKDKLLKLNSPEQANLFKKSIVKKVHAAGSVKNFITSLNEQVKALKTQIVKANKVKTEVSRAISCTPLKLANTLLLVSILVFLISLFTGTALIIFPAGMFVMLVFAVGADRCSE